MNNQKKIVANSSINPAWLNMHGYTNTYAPEAADFSGLFELFRNCSLANLGGYLKRKLLISTTALKN